MLKTHTTRFYPSNSRYRMFGARGRGQLVSALLPLISTLLDTEIEVIFRPNPYLPDLEI